MSTVNGFPENPGLVETKIQNNTAAEDMKQIRKQRMNREAMADPSKMKDLIKAEASPVYNAKGVVIQSAGSL